LNKGVQKPATLVFVESKKEAERFSLGLKALITASSTLSEHENVHFNSELSAAEKKRILQRFYLDGIIRCIVCTQAFGTSVDLPSVRLVVHYCLL
jgi:superfamily II DNA/RNA helicase